MSIYFRSFQGALAQGKELTLFAQKAGDNNGETVIIRRGMGAAVSPVTIQGLTPGGDYHVYAVVTEGKYFVNTSGIISYTQSKHA